MIINGAVCCKETYAQFWDTSTPARNGGFPSPRNYRFLFPTQEVTVDGNDGEEHPASAKYIAELAKKGVRAVLRQFVNLSWASVLSCGKTGHTCR